ncbi:MAG: phosphonoacetaldehyde hydrolase [Armatimonadia bacterium]|nr:phosphonoacetaldehyde hydrolase [Armatimonadia bacterium]
MDFRFARSYRGPVRLVVFDMAGTVVDYGSRAPAGVFVEVFARQNVTISLEQARGPMGMQKRDHIATLTRDPAIAAAWRDVHGQDVAEADIDRMYAEFIPLQIECLSQHDEVVPGALETFRALRERGVKIATTTGYNREMTDIVLAGMERQGLVPDLALCAEDVPKGRPKPWLLFRCMEALDVCPPEAVVKVGDTLPDIEAGLNAGVWTVGVVQTGNMLGLSQDEVEAMSADELEELTEDGYAAMYGAGAHAVVNGVEDCPPVIEEFEALLATGGRP